MNLFEDLSNQSRSQLSMKSNFKFSSSDHPILKCSLSVLERLPDGIEETHTILFSYSPHTVHYLILITEKTKKGEKKIARI